MFREIWKTGWQGGIHHAAVRRKICIRGENVDPGGINFVEITPEDHIFIEDIYNQIIKKYVKIIKSGNGNGSLKTEKVPTFQDAVKFLIEHANFNENDMENFVIRLKGINNKE